MSSTQKYQDLSGFLCSMSTETLEIIDRELWKEYDNYQDGLDRLDNYVGTPQEDRLSMVRGRVRSIIGNILGYRECCLILK